MTIPKIQKNKKMPTEGFGGSTKYPWRSMEVGDSFFIPVKAGDDVDKLQRAIIASSRNVCKRATRRVVERGVRGLRVWRTG